MSRHVKLAFSNAEEHQEVVERWKKKTMQHLNNAQMLCRRINTYKKNTENNANKQRWIADRDALGREQDVSERLLKEALSRIVIPGDDSEEDCSARNSLQNDIKQQLQAIKGKLFEMRMQRSAECHTQALEPELKKISALLDDEKSKIEASEALMESQQRLAIWKSKADVKDIIAHTKARLEQLQEAFSSSELHEFFSEALTREETRLMSQLANVCPPLPTTPAEVLASIELLLKIAQKGRQFDANAFWQKQLSDRVSTVFPMLSRVQINTAINEAEKSRRSKQMAIAFVADYRKVVDQLFATYEMALRVEKDKRILEELVEAEESARQKHQEVLHAHLEQQRAQYAEKCKAKDVRYKMLQEKKELQEKAIQSKRFQEFQQRLEKLAEYEKIKVDIRQKEVELQEIRSQEEIARRAKRMEQNGKRVAFRHGEYEEKLQRLADQEKALLELNRQKEAALQRFFDAVDRQLDVHPSGERLLQATVSSAQSHVYTPFAEAVAVGQSPLMGYTDDEIMRDPRVKLYHALLEAGLHRTPYGREVVSRHYRIPPAQRTSENNPVCTSILPQL